jgi:hypothetical protein
MIAMKKVAIKRLSRKVGFWTQLAHILSLRIVKTDYCYEDFRMFKLEIISRLIN